MRRAFAIATCAFAVLALTGCGEEEKKKEREALKREIREEVMGEVRQEIEMLRADLPRLTRSEIAAYIQQKQDEARRQMEEAARARAAQPRPTTPTTPPRRRN